MFSSILLRRALFGISVLALPLTGRALMGGPGPSSIGGQVMFFQPPGENRQIAFLPNGSCYDMDHYDRVAMKPLPLALGHYEYVGLPSRSGTLKITMNDPAPLVLEGTLSFAYNVWATTSDSVKTVAFSLTPLPQIDPGKLANVSCRSLVDASTPCFAGFIVTGNSPRLLLIRAVGPTLVQFGVPAAVTDPRLEVYHGQDRIGMNDNWGSSTSSVADLNAAFAQVSAFPLIADSKDAATLLILKPGAYTVMGKSDQIGEILLEVYLVE